MTSRYLLTARYMTSLSSVSSSKFFSSSSTQIVTFLDPRDLISKPSSSSSVTFSVPRSLLDQFPKARHHLAEHDDPGNSWSIGEQAEVFDYEMIGSVSCKSGYIAAIPGTPEQLLSSTNKLRLKSFDEYVKLYREQQEQHEQSSSSEASPPPPSVSMPPFLFFGHILENNAAQVYALKQ